MSLNYKFFLPGCAFPLAFRKDPLELLKLLIFFSNPDPDSNYSAEYTVLYTLLYFSRYMHNLSVTTLAPPLSSFELMCQNLDILVS